MAVKQTKKKGELKAFSIFFFVPQRTFFFLFFCLTSFGETSVELAVASQLTATPCPTNRTPPAVATWLHALVSYFTGLL